MLIEVVVVGEVTGVSYLESRVYVVCAGCNTIWLYSAETFRLLSSEAIIVDGMKDPTDIAACRDDRQLYVADADKLRGSPSIWRVTPSGGQLPATTTISFSSFSSGTQPLQSTRTYENQGWGPRSIFTIYNAVT